MPKVRKLSSEEIEQTEQEHLLLHDQPDPEEEAAARSFAGERFPYVWGWLEVGGIIELGRTHDTASFIRVVDTDGAVWEGSEIYASLDDALADADDAIRELEEAGEI